MIGDARHILQEAFRVHQSGDYDGAELLYKEVLRLDPNCIDAHHLLGLALHELGQHAEAAIQIRQALTLSPDNHVLLNSLGVALMATSQLDAASVAFRQAISIAPQNTEALLNLAVCLFEGGNDEDSWHYFEESTSLAPEWGYAQLRYGASLLQAGAKKEAVDRLEIAAKLDPNCLQSRLKLAHAFLSDQDLSAAHAWFEQVRALNPQHPDALLNLARIAEKQQRLDVSVQHCVALLRMDAACAPAHLLLGVILSSRLRPEYRLKLDLRERNELIEKSLDHLSFAASKMPAAETLDALGVGLMRADRHVEAIEKFQLALQHDNRFAPVHEHLGKALLELGRTQEAKAEFGEAIALNPNQPLSHYELAQMSDEGVEVTLNAVNGLEQLLDQQKTSRGKSFLHFALAKRFEKAKCFDEAFVHYRKGGQLKSEMLDQEDGAQERRDLPQVLMDRTATVFDPSFFEQRKSWGSPSRRPIFIVGMPRSGTSLMEQILSSHPDVFGAGELIDINDLGLSLSRRLNSNQKYPEIARALKESQVSELADEYLAVLEGRDRLARYVTDKMPTNFRHLGLISLLFPQAKVLHMRRDPLDVCVSCFRQNLEWPFCDLEAVARYYCGYHGLMQHWRDTISSEILDVRYESVVEDQEGVTRQVLEFLDLPWHDQCLQFHSTERAVRTPSKWQVRQPIYRSSVGAWRRFGRHLDKVRGILAGAQ